MAWPGINVIHEILESIQIYYYAEHKVKTSLKSFRIISKYFHSKNYTDKTLLYQPQKC